MDAQREKTPENRVMLTPEAQIVFQCWRQRLGLGLAAVVLFCGFPEWLALPAGWLSGLQIPGVDPLTMVLAGQRMVQELVIAQTWPLVPVFISAGLLLAVWLMAPVSLGRHMRQRLRLTPVARDETAMAVGAVLLAEPIMHIIFLWWSGYYPSVMSRDAVLPVPMLGGLASAPWWAGVGMILTVSLLVPIAEELFFRGRLLDFFRSWCGGTRMATIIAVGLTTLAFAAAHGSPVHMLFALPFGLLLAIIRLRSGNIGGCIVAHACHNSMFLFLGPTLFAKPWVAALFAASGVMLLAAAWAHHPRTSDRPRVPNRWRPWVACALVAVALLVIRLTAPAYHRVQDHYWVIATHKIITQWVVDNDILLQRLEHQRLRGRLHDVRAAGLFHALQAQPCPSHHGSNPRQTQVLAQLMPEHFAQQLPADVIYDALADLCDSHVVWPQLVLAARALGQRDPVSLAEVAIDNPMCLAQWFPLATALDACAEQIAASHGPSRRRILAACEHAFPGRVSDILFRLSPDHVTAHDRRHLFTHYPDARERLGILAEHNPALALAFLQ
jgi:membrane protease YdiL (CAAX protease family)